MHFKVLYGRLVGVGQVNQVQVVVIAVQQIVRGERKKEDLVAGNFVLGHSLLVLLDRKDALGGDVKVKQVGGAEHDDEFVWLVLDELANVLALEINRLLGLQINVFLPVFTVNDGFHNLDSNYS